VVWIVKNLSLEYHSNVRESTDGVQRQECFDSEVEPGSVRSRGTMLSAHPATGDEHSI
jgi:hypothetical protein